MTGLVDDLLSSDLKFLEGVVLFHGQLAFPFVNAAIFEGLDALCVTHVVLASLFRLLFCADT